MNTTASEGRPSYIYRSVGSAFQADIPILIPCFNTVTYVRGMVDQLREYGLKNIILMDNVSTYPPMCAYLNAPGEGVRVILQTKNTGPHGIFLDEASYGLLPQFFCVTDPDLLFNPKMPGDFIAQLLNITEKMEIGKIGLALDISDREIMKQENFIAMQKGRKIWEHEQKYWENHIGNIASGDPVYNALIDTTFAVYNKKFFTKDKFFNAPRVAGTYTCKHLPWYLNTGLPEEEELFYQKTSKHSFFLSNQTPEMELRHQARSV